ncbi:MAG: hypothetical protein M1457_06700 [bacterium]|nr:hypothetical protein [bacterium]
MPARADPTVASIWVKYQSRPVGEAGEMAILPWPGSYEIDAREVAARAGELAMIEPV